MSDLLNGFYYQITISIGVLTNAEIENNVRRIVEILRPLGWTDSAIAGLVANIQSEGIYNPGQCENLNGAGRIPYSEYEPNYPNGLGLCQWTSQPNLLMEYAHNNNRKWYDGEIQCRLINTGVNYFVQEINGYIWNHDFQEFKTWTGDPGEAAIGWLYNYERPASLWDERAAATRRVRAERAQTWYEFITGIPYTSNPKLIAILTATRKKNKRGGIKIK